MLVKVTERSKEGKQVTVIHSVHWDMLYSIATLQVADMPLPCVTSISISPATPKMPIDNKTRVSTSNQCSHTNLSL
jgi:hypothetical protein